MQEQVSIVLKNLVIKGVASDDKGKFELVSTGDIKLTADPDTVAAMAAYLEEVVNNEN